MYPWHELIGIVSVWNPQKTDYWFSIYNRVLLHYSVSIAAAAATTAHIHLSAEAAEMYIPVSAAAAAHSPRSALLGYLVEIPQWEHERDRKHHWSTTQHFEQLRSHPKGNHPLSVTSLSDTSHPVAMLLTVIRNGTFCTTTMVRKKVREYAEHTSGYDVTSGHVTSCDVISG
jgi:hypothetical protein